MRVLALTGDTQLQLALLSMLPDWEFQTVRDQDEAVFEARSASLALLDCGSTEAGLEAARALHHDGVTIPCVVIGEDQPPQDASAHVLLRPFTLDQLGDMVSAVAEEARAIADGRDSLHALVAEEETQPEPEAREPDALVPETVVKLPEPEIPEPEPEPAPLAPVLELVVPEPVEPQAAPVEEAASLFADLGWSEPDEPVGAPVAPSKPVITARPLARPAPHEILPQRAPARAAARKRLRRRTSSSHAPPPPGSILDRLSAAEASGRQLENLLAELPVLAEQRAVAHAFLREVVELFGPKTAAVYTQRPDGAWAVVAPHGLSSVESQMRVAADQPLFAEVLSARAGVFIAPVDLAQGLVAGIGGARTEALMVAPLEVNDRCIGMVVVGGDQLTEVDLERLCDLAGEAAPGLAFAQLVERLRARLWSRT